MAPLEIPQECPQRGWRLDHAAENASRPTGAQHVGIVDAVAAGQRRRRQRQQLASHVGRTWHVPQVNVFVHQLAQSQMTGAA